MNNIEHYIQHGRILITTQRHWHHSEYLVALVSCHELALLDAHKHINSQHAEQAILADLVLTSPAVLWATGSSLIDAMNRLDIRSEQRFKLTATVPSIGEAAADFEEQLNDFYMGQLNSTSPETIPAALVEAIDHWDQRYQSLLKEHRLDQDVSRSRAYATKGGVYFDPEKVYAEAEDHECVVMMLNSLSAPTHDIDGLTYSTVGRIFHLLRRENVDIVEDLNGLDGSRFKIIPKPLSYLEEVKVGAQQSAFTSMEFKQVVPIDAFVTNIRERCHELAKGRQNGLFQIDYRFLPSKLGLLDVTSEFKPKWIRSSFYTSSRVYSDPEKFDEWVRYVIREIDGVDQEKQTVPDSVYVRLYWSALDAAGATPWRWTDEDVTEIPPVQDVVEPQITEPIPKKDPPKNKIDYLVTQYEAVWEEILRNNDSFEGALEAMTKPIILGVAPIQLLDEDGNHTTAPKEIRLTSEEAEAIIRKMRG